MKELTEEQNLYVNKKIAYVALLLQEYAYREILDSPLCRQNSRQFMKSKLQSVKNNLLQINKNSGVDKKTIQEGEDVLLENVSLMASVLGTIAIVPASQVDYIEKEFTKICLQAIENDKTK
tara:strand:+ start:4250 stop:4612 length:363 start_codon:yes stop_codon:yes gene_type:complete